MICESLNQILLLVYYRAIIMHPEDLNNIWVCSNCQTAFAFHSDMMDHAKKAGHKQIKKFDLNTGRILEVRAMV
jgi:hypothetical protein